MCVCMVAQLSAATHQCLMVRCLRWSRRRPACLPPCCSPTCPPPPPCTHTHTHLPPMNACLCAAAITPPTPTVPPMTGPPLGALLRPEALGAGGPHPHAQVRQGTGERAAVAATASVLLPVAAAGGGGCWCLQAKAVLDSARACCALHTCTR
jgi:hypothetical protein